MNTLEFTKAFGISPDDLIEGFRYVEKRNELFVFTDCINEANFNIDGIRSLIRLKISQISNIELEKKLNEMGIFIFDFELFNHELQSLIKYSIVDTIANSNFVLLKDDRGENHKVHYSLLIEAQFDSHKKELKKIERDFFTSDLRHNLSRVQTIRSHFEQTKSYSLNVPEIDLAFRRIKLLIEQKLSTIKRDDPIREFIKNLNI